MDCLIEIYNLSKKYDCNWLTIGKESKFGHPHHPLYLSSEDRIRNFNIDSYIEKLIKLVG